MIWFIRIALVATAILLIRGARWMDRVRTVRERNRRLSITLVIWAVCMAVLLITSGEYIFDDMPAFLLAAANFIMGFPCLLAVILVYILRPKYRKPRQ